MSFNDDHSRTCGGLSLGSVTGLINAAGSKVNSYSYDPYGVRVAATESVPNPFQYTAGHYDATTGLYKFGIRYYDPTLGRFTQPDPTGQDPHYTYAANNPVNYLDPSGAGCVGNYLGLAAGVVGYTASAAAIFTGAGTALGVVGAGASLVGIGTAADAISEDGCLD